ncbi:MAG: YDG domain-containing protein [Methylotenera sp.]|nr:YDG domain-containing protein [Methylotenera sp.]
MNKTTNTAQTPPSMTLRLSRGRSIKITWRPRQRISSLLVKLLTKALAIFLPLSMGYAHAADVNALPTGGRVSAGKATINQTGNTLNINQTSQKAALNWQNFNIGSNSTVNFVQPNSNAVALNRIGGNAASEIYGHLNANGQVFLMNPNGILFGRGSQVNVGGIVATTMQLGDADFLAGNYNFNNAGAGSVANYGLINATNSVALLGGDVSNQGSIFATTASLVSGKTVALDVSTDGLIRARVVDVAIQANIANSGDINATQVTLSAGQAKDTLNRVVNNSGVIKATGFSSLNGKIVLQGGTTLNSGTLDATSATGNGGTVRMLGQHVGVVDSGSIDVSGATGGGTILVGGDYQGKNTSIENAEVTYVGAQTTLRADATQNGNGGKVIVWADDTTRTYGSISAQGGVLGGDGGFVETSGHRYLDVNGVRVDTRAGIGLAGTWLLDPNAIDIIHYVGSTPNNFNINGTSPFAPTQSDNTTSILTDYTINQNLHSGNVVVQTVNPLGTSGTSSSDITFKMTSGSISICAAVGNICDVTSNVKTLEFRSDDDIIFASGSNNTTTFATAGAGSLSVNFQTASGKQVKVNSGATAIFNGGGGGVLNAYIGGTGASGQSWENSGVITLSGDSYIDLNKNGNASTFNNLTGAELNLGSTQGYAIQSSSSSRPINNNGTINVTALTAVEAAYSQTIDGTLNIADGQYLNLQNAISLVGNNSADINLNATGILNINEYHGTVASLSNLTFAGTGGTLNVSGTVGGTPTATFGGVKAPEVTLNVGATSNNGNVTITGNSLFKTVVVNNTTGTFKINNAKLGITNTSFTVPSSASYLGDVGYYAAGDLTIANNLTVPGALNLMAGWNKTTDLASAVTGSSTGHISLAASTSISSTGGNINIIAKTDFTAGASSSISASGNRWLIWVPNPNAIIGNCGTGSGCLASFAQYGANFASNPTVLGTGNGLMYSDTLSLTSTLGGAVTKVYNGSNAISLTGATFGALQASPADSLGGPFYNDVISPVTITGGTGTLSSINVGTGISVTATGMTVTGIKTSSATGSIPVYGYSFTASGNIGEVTPAPASPISLSGSRVYDVTNIVDASIFSLSGLVGSETLTLSGSGTVADKKVGNNKPVSLGSLTLGNGSGSASNYTFTGGTWLASITPASISVSGITAADRAYNSTTAATLNTSGISFGGLITGDVLSVSATGAFINKNVGVGKTVNISGIALTGTDAGNYTLASSTATTTATISPAALAISGAVADNKVYDGTTSANLSSVGSITGVFSGDSLGNVTGATAAFSDREIGAAKLVNFSLLFDGIDANNYMASGTTTANITKASSSTDDVVNVITDLTQPENYDTQGNQDTNQGNQDNTQAKQSEQDDTVTRGVLEVLSGFENNQTEKEAPITEQPKGRTLQCSFNK